MSGKSDHFKHRRRICDGYFPNSLQPISYLRNICDLYVFRPDKKFRKNNQISWTRDSQCQNSADRSAKITQMHKNLSAQFVFINTKVWYIIDWKKSSLGVHSPWFQGLLLDYQADRDNRSGEDFYYKKLC